MAFTKPSIKSGLTIFNFDEYYPSFNQLDISKVCSATRHPLVKTIDNFLGYASMEPFNIRIGYGAKEVSLTILPIGDQQFKVIYYGAVLGGLKYAADCWEAIAPEDLEAGDLPFYHHDVNSGNVNVILNDATVDEIGAEIEHLLPNESDY